MNPYNQYDENKSNDHDSPFDFHEPYFRFFVENQDVQPPEKKSAVQWDLKTIIATILLLVLSISLSIYSIFAMHDRQYIDIDMIEIHPESSIPPSELELEIM